MRHTFFTIVGVLMLILSVVGCDRVQKVVVREDILTSEVGNTVKIGFLASGSRITYPNGAQIAVSEINASGGLFGMPVELIAEVGIHTPDAAVAAASKMILEEGIIALIGPNRSAHAIPRKCYYIRGSTPNL